MNRFTSPLIVLVACIAASLGAVAAQGQRIGNADILREAWTVVNERFFDPDFNGVDWPAVLETYEPRAAAAQTPQELSAVINDMLAELKTSHMGCYTPLDREYYELVDIFNRGGDFGAAVHRVFRRGIVRYEGIGIVTRESDGKIFISDVLEGLPAHRAGLQRGDEVISVDGEPFHPIRSFLGKAGEPVAIVLQSAPDEASRTTMTVSPAWIRPTAAFRQSIIEGARMIEHSQRKIAYVRIRSYASESYQEALVELITADGPLAAADALVLDIRGGWGGANPQYLDLFNDRIPAMTMTGRDGATRSSDQRWRKPVVLLVDRGSRSGKEVIAHGFKQHKVGPIVGERTAGAVVGGMPAILSDGSLLVVAVVDVEVDGVRLEGRGVEPDVVVEDDLPYAAGKDPQLDKAVDVAAGLLEVKAADAAR